MANEDFTTWTEVDTQSELTVTKSRITWADLGWQAVGNVHKDFGEGWKTGDLTILFTVYCSTVDSILMETQLMNLQSTTTMGESNFDIVLFEEPPSVAGFTLGLINTGGVAYDQSIDLSLSTPYYCTLTRVANVVTIVFYDDAARTNTVDTISIDPGNKVTIRHLYLVNSENVTADGDGDGYLENLDAGEVYTSPIMQPGKYWGPI